MAGIVPQSHEINLTSTNPSSSINQHLFLAILNQSISSFLERFHAGYFRISLALGGQTLLWKSLLEPTRTSSNPFLSHVLDKLHHPIFLMVLWSFSLFILIIFSLLYMLKCLFYFDKVKAEFLHHIGVNYLFAPWISWLLLLQSTPFVPPRTTAYMILWWVFAVPVVVLDIKIYGQWFTQGKRFQLTVVANPTSQLSVIGNLVSAQAAMQTGWKESAVCLFSLGMVHYLVLFVTLYQRLSGSDVLPSLLTPVFFLFFAAPSVASLAWDSIVGNFDTASKMLFFLSLFLFASLVCRPALFKKAMRNFSVVWWSYSFPVTVLAIASTEYAQEVKGGVADAMVLILSLMSFLVMLVLSVLTLLKANTLLLPATADNDTVLTANVVAYQNSSLPTTG
ncbi:hypothetical protein Droror1_Dr00005933 [Drosera rotundifolia]